MTDRPLYDSRAVLATEWPIAAWWFFEHGPVWERLPERAGMIYLRRHLGGRIQTTSPDWYLA